jgi:thiol-disulfide isomerase/thioredoxin
LPLGASALGVGEAAPDFALPGLNGAVKLAALRGKPVYLDFWASWCGPCKQSFPWMNSLQSRFGPQGLQVVAVSVDSQVAEAKQFLASNPAQFTVAFDAAGDTPRRYAIKGMPTSVLIAPDGKVVLIHAGFRAEDKAELEAKISQALAAASSSTKP